MVLTIRCVWFCCVDSDEDPGGGSGEEDQPLEDLTNLHFKFEVKEVCGWLFTPVSPGLGLGLG